MKKLIAVMILLIGLLVVGCSEKEPAVNVSESNENSELSLDSSASQSPNSSNQEASSSGQEQSLAAGNRFTDSTQTINPYAFIEMTGTPPLLHGPTGFTVMCDGWNKVYLSYEKSKELILGIDFSQLQLIGETDETSFSSGPVHPQPPPGAKPLTIVFENYLECALLLRGSQNIAIYQVTETDRGNQDSPINDTYYSYSMSDEFYDAVCERLEEYLQYDMFSSVSQDPYNPMVG